MPNIDIRFQRLGIFNHMWLMAVNKTGFNQTKWLTAVITANKSTSSHHNKCDANKMIDGSYVPTFFLLLYHFNLDTPACLIMMWVNPFTCFC